MSLSRATNRCAGPGFGCVLAALIASSAIGQRSAPTVSELYRRAVRMAATVDQISDHIGKPEVVWHPMPVLNPLPRTFYHQTYTILRKSERLCFELTHQSVPLDRLIKIRLAPDLAGTQYLLGIIEGRLRKVEDRLELEAVPRSDAALPEISSRDLFQILLRVSGQIDLMLERPFGPSEIYERVTLAVGHAARIRALSPGRRIPLMPPMPAESSNEDLCRLLLDGLTVLQPLVDRMGGPSIGVDERHRLPIRCEQAYDIAALLTGEIDYLRSRFANTRPPRPDFDPGEKKVAEATRQVELLLSQLEELQTIAERNPKWAQRK